MSIHLHETLEACLAKNKIAYSLPPETYTDPEHLISEQKLIFENNWIGLGRADRFRETGSFEAIDILGHALLIVRGKDGKLRTFANACRHRGARLTTGSGKCGGFRCPFHSWAYKLDGSLANAPQMDQIEDFDKAEHSLISYETEERFGFLFIFLGLEPTSNLDDQLLGFQDLHMPWSMEKLLSTRRISMTVNCNWKAFLEVFNEYYHLPFIHPNSVDAIYNKPDQADAVSGTFTSQFGSTEGTGGLLQDSQDSPLPDIPSLSGKAAKGVRYTWLFPNMTFAAGTDAMWVYEAYPLTAHTCLVYQTACFPIESTRLPDFEDRVQPYYHRLDAAIAEDIPALENQQSGLKSPKATQGPFHPLLEANVASFANWYSSLFINSKK